MQRSHATSRALALVAFGLYCEPSRAHLNSTGIGPLYDGLAHFLTSPHDFVPVFGLALLAGLRGADFSRRTLATLPLAWLAGAVAGLTGAMVDMGSLWTSAWLLLMGGLVVADVKLSMLGITGLAALLGLVQGYVNGSGMGASFYTVQVAIGLASAVFVLVVVVSGFVVRLQAHWMRIAVRVGGSWIAASGLLMLGWSMRSL